MNHLAIVRVISAIALGFAGLFAVSFLVALASGEADQQMVFAGTGATIGGFGGTVLLLTDKPKKAGPREGWSGRGYSVLAHRRGYFVRTVLRLSRRTRFPRGVL